MFERLRPFPKKPLRFIVNRCCDALWRLRWGTVRLLTPRRTVDSRGIRLTLQCDNWITHYRWASYNSKEPETLDWIDSWIRDGETLFDIGANIGVYTIYAALRHPRLRIVAFEPEYANLHLLRDNLFANALQDRIEVYAIALSDSSGLSHLYIQDLTPGAALHTESTSDLSRTLMRRPVIWREGISTSTLDSFCEATALHPNHIKIDVDGTEPKVLQGGVKTLTSPMLKSVLIELPDEKHSRRACEHLLHSAGLSRRWQHATGKTQNEVWVRSET
jgi:FkbM family methyltransferase